MKQFESVLNWFIQFFRSPVVIGSASVPSSGMQLTVAGNIGPEADNTRSIGSTTLRMATVQANKVNTGLGPSGPTLGYLNIGSEVEVQHIVSDTAANASGPRFLVVTRRSRGTLAAKTNVTSGDNISDFEFQADPAGSGAYVQCIMKRYVVETRTGTTAIGGQEQTFTRPNVAGGGSTLRFSITADGNVVIGDQASALATTTVNGFLYIPSCAGVPTGVPTAYGAMVPMVYDTTNLRLYIYAGGAWRIH